MMNPLMSCVIVACIVSAMTSTTTPSTTKPLPTSKAMSTVTGSKYRFIENTHNNEYHVAANIGDNYVMSCETAKTDTIPRVNWTKDGKPVASINFRFFHDGDLSQTFKLTFTDMMVTDAGTYKCMVGDEGGKMISKQFKVVVKETPENEILIAESLFPRDVSISVGQSVRFTCKGKGANDIAKFFIWEHSVIHNRSVGNDHKPSVLTRKVEQCAGQSVLQIADVQISDSGKIACVIANQRGYVRIETLLTVKEKSLDKSATSAHLSIIIPIVVLCFVIIAAIAGMYGWRIYKRYGIRKRTHSYHYTSTSDSKF